MPVRLGWVAASITAGVVISLGAPAIASTPQADAPATAAEEAVTPPNILLIVTDDQRAGTEVAMPTVMSEIAAKGINYPNAFVPTSACCPSRVSLLTGKLAHNSGVWSNEINSAWGGWSAFSLGGEESDTMATRLQGQGYHTGLFGKYLNGAASRHRKTDPPGWDKWVAFLAGDHTAYRLSTDSGRSFGWPREYLTDALADDAVDFIASAPADQPVFTYFAPYAPHYPFEPGPYTGATRAAGLLDDVKAATRYPSPATNQPDMSAYPEWMQQIPQSDTWLSSSLTMDELVERQSDMLMGVDAGIRRILDALSSAGRLDNTLIVFMSDNGFSWGEHRMQRKNTPYDSSVRVPLVMRFPGNVPAGVSDPRVVAANVDVYATIMSLAGAQPGGKDGVSVVSSARDGVVMEASSWAYRVSGAQRWVRPAYCGYRTADHLYVRYASGEEELYDYGADPHELRNLAGNPAYSAIKTNLLSRSRATCSPMPPGFTWDGAATPLEPPTNVRIRPIGRSGLIVTWRAPMNVGNDLPVYEVYLEPAPGKRPACTLRSQGLTQGLRCRVETPGKRRTTEVTVVSVRGDERAASPAISRSSQR